ncbi:extracellular solute-binding protein [Phaeobacter italicus]|uniref:extracellular solute-binding protein n=1 Tax=Phaeobacter italicus TaxID=481446 RepID=UPI0016DDEC6E|nr:extracellular solute-binding protein [Phaeobacter italicus]MEC8016577.1 extracellular solute-binding protein [Pseudomonadota bacterium]MBY5975907.1 extracellular solute-binding protein [Phaeobacter italicus]MCA0857524.1 extracellular solute-binding protein [Phaeobacter italicus]MCI5099951.1 extracellular solute-binding protein [Phaeobacter italicus]GLO75767.1 ABC transporter substrate-binding protein [Phaeobacter italicus]|mmetsp:Transcript_24449/g.31873  ORF Transcript_24449/g.31873 Transcript_24449/m.31873 type:complete len:434 (+) Transcript_24449:174-1475(+)
MKRIAFTTAATLAFAANAAFAETEITWWHAMGGALGDTVNQIASDFNASQDEYKITPVFKGTYEETLTAGIAAFRAGEQPNVMQVFDAGAATVIGAKGATIPVQDLLADNGVDFDINDYIAGVRYFYADSDGKMIGMPFNSSTPIMYFNVQALEKAGVSAPKTWEEFQTVTAPALKEAGYTALSQSHLPWIFTENFHSRHNLPFATNNNGYDGTDTQILVNNDAIKAHFSAVKDWKDNGYFEWFGTGWGDNQTPFEEGKVAMWLGSSGSFGGLSKKDLPFDFSATMLPYWEGVTKEPTQTFIGGASLFAMAGHDEEENKATAAFFDFLTSAEVQYFWHKETGYVPITEAAYEMAKADGHYDRAPAAEVGIQQLSLPGGDNTKGYRMGFYVQIRDVMNREYGRILTGETSVEDAFKTIEDEANNLLARFAKTQG